MVDLMNPDPSNRNLAAVVTGILHKTTKLLVTVSHSADRKRRSDLLSRLEAIKTENADANHKPKMPTTTMSETALPKSGGTRTPAETPTTGVNK
jgi:hypothetical protein